MKSSLLFFAAFLAFGPLQSQTLRYFEVHRRDHQPSDPWRDSAYVVAASDPVLLAEIEAELSKPEAARRHINNVIDSGNGGFNRNAGYWFNWHSRPDAWQFAEISAEVCDGRAYSDVASDTAYWIGTVGQYCGWAYCVAREVDISVPALVPVAPSRTEFLPIAPNPVDGEVVFSWLQASEAAVTLNVAEAAGRLSITLPLGQKDAGRNTKDFATAALTSGVYVATLRVGRETLVQRFVVAH